MTTDPSSPERSLPELIELLGEAYYRHPAHSLYREAAATIERLSAERMQLREALEGAADELQSCADQFRALKMTTCAQYAEAQETKARAALSNTAENG